jgi:hypothetical protein
MKGLDGSSYYHPPSFEIKDLLAFSKGFGYLAHAKLQM